MECPNCGRDPDFTLNPGWMTLYNRDGEETGEEVRTHAHEQYEDCMGDNPRKHPFVLFTETRKV